MPATEIAAALQRVQGVLQRRPAAAVQADAPAAAHWGGGLRVVTRHPGGTEVLTDMPGELGGSGDQVSPGWLVRAGYASCAVTAIAMVAAERGIALQAIDVETRSVSDTRGLLGMHDADGTAISPGPSDMRTVVRIAAPGVAAADVHAIVDEAERRSAVGRALREAVPIALQVEIVEPAGER